MLTATDMALFNRGADVRNHVQLLSDLERLQNDIRARVLSDDWTGITELIVLKGRWENVLIEAVERILHTSDGEFFNRLYEYSIADLGISELIKSRMTVLETEIRKAAVARKVLSRIRSVSNPQTEQDAARGNFVDRSG